MKNKKTAKEYENTEKKDRNERVLRARKDGKTFDQISKEFQISKTRVLEIVRRYTKIEQCLNKRG